MAGVPYVFGNATTSIPLSNLDADFNTPVTIGTSTVGLGNTTTSLVGLSNVSTTIVGSTGNLTIQSGSTTAITVDTSQNVGIGTTTPQAKLDITVASGKNLALTKTGGAYLSYLEGATQRATINGFSGADGLQFTYGASSTEAMRIDSSGYVGIGITTAIANANGLFVRASIGDSYFNHITGTVTGSGYTQFIYGGVLIGNITQNGTTGVLYNLTSDYRLKNNPVALTGASEFIMALQPKTWDWYDGSGKGVGFIAHEFMEVAKYSGNGKKDEVETVDDFDVDGKKIGTKEVPKYQSIQPSSSEVMANLVGLVQELKTIVDTQAIQISALQAKVGV